MEKKLIFILIILLLLISLKFFIKKYSLVEEDLVLNEENVKFNLNIINKLPTSRSHQSCSESSFNNKIYCFGGRNGGSFSDEIIEYDPKKIK